MLNRYNGLKYTLCGPAVKCSEAFVLVLHHGLKQCWRCQFCCLSLVLIGCCPCRWINNAGLGGRWLHANGSSKAVSSPFQPILRSNCDTYHGFCLPTGISSPTPSLRIVGEKISPSPVLNFHFSLIFFWVVLFWILQ